MRWSLIDDLYGQTSSAAARVIPNHHWLDARRIPLRIEPAGAQTADMRRLPIAAAFRQRRPAAVGSTTR
jgi:hypothetical protein